MNSSFPIATASRGPLTRKHLLVLMGILLVCAGVRLWLIHRSDSIAKDGVIYLEMASKWDSNPAEVAKNYAYPPGYPAAVAGVHRLVLIAGMADGRESWEWAGRAVSVVSSLAAMVAIYFLAGLTFNWPIAALTTLLFGIGKKWSCLGADALSDCLAISMQLWATVGMLAVLSMLRRGVRWAPTVAAGAGMLAGLGYLIRQESLWVIFVACTVWLGRYVIRRRNLWLTLASIVAMAAAAGVVAAPYMMTIGGLSNKKIVGRISGLASLVGEVRTTASVSPASMPSAAAAAEDEDVHTSPTALKILQQIMAALQPIIGGFFLVGLLGLAVCRWGPGRALGSLMPMPTNAGKALFVAAAVVVLPILALLHQTAGYVSHRHVMFLAAVLSPLATAGILWVAGMASRVGKLRRVRPELVAVILVCVVFVCVAFDTMQYRPHRNKDHDRQAAHPCQPDRKPRQAKLWITQAGGGLCVSHWCMTG